MLKSDPSLHYLELEDPTACVPLRIDLLLSSSLSSSSNDDDNNNKNYIADCDVNTTGIYLEGSMVVVREYHKESLALFHSDNDTGGGSGTYFCCTSIELPPIELKLTTELHLSSSPYSYDDEFQQQQQRQHQQRGCGYDGESNKQRDLLSIDSLSNLSLDDPEYVDWLENIIDCMVKRKQKRKKSNNTVDQDDVEERI